MNIHIEYGGGREGGREGGRGRKREGGETERGRKGGKEREKKEILSHSKSAPRSNLVESLNSTPTLESESWYPSPYLSL